MVSTSNPSFHSKFRFSIFILVNIIAILHLGKDLLFSFSHSLYLPFLGFLLLLTMDLLFLLDGFIPFLRPRSGFLFREVMNILFLGFCWLFYLSLSLSKKCKPCLPFTLLLLLISILSLLPLQINIPHLSPSDPDKTQRILYHLCQSSLLFLMLLYGFFVRKHNIYFLLALLCCVVSTILFIYTLSSLSSSSLQPSSSFYQTWEWFEEDWTLLLELSLLLLVIFTSNGWLSTFYNHTH